MNWYESIKKWYPELWDIERVKNAVVKGKITAEQYKEITGEVYTTWQI